MKRASILTLLIILIVLSSTLVLAGDNSATKGCKDKLACNSTLNSAAGFGAVEICGTCSVCGESDGICPEDFYSGGLQGSCASCPDPDCTATLSGRVVEGSRGLPLNGAEIKAKYPGESVFKTITETKTDGQYSKSDAKSANPIKLYATYTDYEGDKPEVYNSKSTIEISLSRGKTRNINFTLLPAQCEKDCTRERNDVCDATCQGINGCDFAHNENYSSNYTKTKLDGYELGKKVVLNSTTVYEESKIVEDVATTCTGPINTTSNFLPVGVCGKNGTSQSAVIPSDNDKENLITKTVRVYTEDGKIAILTIVYWEGENSK